MAGVAGGLAAALVAAVVGAVGASCQSPGAGEQSSATASGLPSASAQTWRIRWVIDGDTVDVVDASGARLRLRLVNVNAPEVPRNGAPGQCLGEQAATWVRERLPVGAPVTIATYGLDRYGRTVADLRTASLGSVSVAVTAAGLAAPMVVGRDGPDPVIDAVDQAAEQAGRAQVGLHSPAVTCTIPGHAQALAASAAKLPATPTTAAMPAARAAVERIRASNTALLAELGHRPEPAPVAALSSAQLTAAKRVAAAAMNSVARRTAQWPAE